MSDDERRVLEQELAAATSDAADRVRNQVAIAQELLRSLLLANGGAIVALFTFVGNLLTKTPAPHLVAGRLYIASRCSSAASTGTTTWLQAGSYVPTLTAGQITSVASGASYDLAVSYRVRGVIGGRLIIPGLTAGTLALAGVASSGDLETASEQLNTLIERINSYAGSGPIP